jgi:hypothetical protein
MAKRFDCRHQLAQLPPCRALSLNRHGTAAYKYQIYGGQRTRGGPEHFTHQALRAIALYGLANRFACRNDAKPGVVAVVGPCQYRKVRSSRLTVPGKDRLKLCAAAQRSPLSVPRQKLSSETT